ncbi:MAG: hypothetical protein AAFX50_01620, partial [Acidobacteriota bacterium]
MPIGPSLRPSPRRARRTQYLRSAALALALVAPLAAVPATASEGQTPGDAAMEARIDALIERMTVEEKVGQMT